MKFRNPLISVKDMDRSVSFYKDVLGLEVELDFGANKTLTGGLVLQTEETWRSFIGAGKIDAGNGFELYFEAEDFSKFEEKMKTKEVRFVHPVKEHAWGQRVVRFYDPDGHIVEVGEDIKAVCRRFYESGMTPEQVAARMDVPVEFVKDAVR